ETPAVTVGDWFDGTVTGVIDYSLGNYRVVATSLPSVSSSLLTRESAAPVVGSQLAVATFNLENLYPALGPEKFGALASEIITNLGAPDLIAVQEVQDSNGPVNDSEVDAASTFALLVDAFAAAGGPAYAARDISPERGRDGGQPGGNIRVGFLF